MPALAFVHVPPVTTTAGQAPIWLLNTCKVLDFLMTEHPKVMSTLPLCQLGLAMVQTPSPCLHPSTTSKSVPPKRATFHLAHSRCRSPRIRLPSQACHHPCPSSHCNLHPHVSFFDTKPLLQIIIDAVCVLIDLGYTLLTSDCEPPGGVDEPE
jgi:hypothetical protein